MRLKPLGNSFAERVTNALLQSSGLVAGASFAESCPRFALMLFRLSCRNDVGPFVVARRPDNDQYLACMPAKALEAQLAIGLGLLVHIRRAAAPTDFQPPGTSSKLGPLRE
jgi:hypothetical protein